MIVRILASIPLAFLVALAVWFWAENNYNRNKYASREAQTTRDLLEHHSEELKASAIKSDMILYGILGAGLAALCGAWSHTSTTIPGRIRGLLVGAVIGGLAGAGGGWLGHWFDTNVSFPTDPIVYWFGRWAVMLAPLAVASGIAAAVSGSKPVKDLVEAIAGGLLGVAIAVTIYCLASGAISPIEEHQYIYPSYQSNRLMVLALATVFVSAMITFRLGSSSGKQTSAPPSGENADPESNDS